jgi:hypothetical protein
MNKRGIALLEIIIVFVAVSSILLLVTKPQFTGFTINGIEENNFEILLKSRQFTPENMVDASLQNAILEQERVHVLVQMDRIPTDEEKQILENQGIKLMTYIPNKAWFASVPSNSINELTSIEGIRYAGMIQSQDKAPPRVINQDFDSWAIIDSDNVLLTIQFYPDSVNEIENIISKYNLIVGSRIDSINSISASINKSQIQTLLQEDSIQWVEEVSPPLTALNDGARSNIGANVVQGSRYNLKGNGVTVTVFDGDLINNSHKDFGNRVTLGEGGSFADHATHVAGTVGGDGTQSQSNGGTAYQWKGMAPNVSIISYYYASCTPYCLYNSSSDIQSNYNSSIYTYNSNLVTNSIGSNVVSNGYNCSWLGDYETTAQLIDNIARGSLGKSYLQTWAAGNERQLGAPCGQYATIGNPAAAKNPIVVGAVNSNDNSLTFFTSLGPVDDGRLKPDIVAPGCQSGGDGGIKSAAMDGTYTVMCGTSMATPVVAGSAALLFEEYNLTHHTKNVYPSTMKALFIQSATDINNTGPDYATGYGAINVTAAADIIISDNSNNKVITEGNITNQGVNSFYRINLPSKPQLKLTLVWDDYPGTPAAATELVNNLDLIVVSPNGTRYYPWKLNASNPGAAATKGIDNINNVEQVVVASPETGIWNITINGTSVPQPSQTFSLITSSPILAYHPCSGGYLNSTSGKCIYLSSSAGASCDSVCSGKSLACNTTTVLTDSGCTFMNMLLGYESSSCSSCQFGSGTYWPYVSVSTLECDYLSSPANQNCTATYGFARRLCACDAVMEYAPTQNTPIVNSTFGTNLSTENITCYPQNLADSEGDAVYPVFNWMKNNNPLAILNMPFDVDSSTVNDYSGFGNNGVFVGSPIWTSGIRGGAYRFNGINTAIDISNSSIFDMTGDFTIEAWIYQGQNQTSETSIVAKGDANDGGQYALNMLANNRPRFIAKESTCSGTSYFYGTNNISNNQWSHVVFARNGTTRRFYINGLLDNEDNFFYSGALCKDGKDLFIGSRPSGGFFNGSIDGVRIYNKALSAQQVMQNYIEGINSINTSTIVSDQLVGGNWTCSVTPNDMLVEGQAASSSIIILSGQNITDCAGINVANTTYYLQNDVSSLGNCFIVSAENTTLDCQGYSITGSGAGTAIDASSATNGYNLTIQNCTIRNFNLDVNASASPNPNLGGYHGGSVTIINSNLTRIYSYGEKSQGGGGSGGDGGNIALTNSNASEINSYGGTSSQSTVGNGGSVTLTNSSTGKINAFGGTGGIFASGGGIGGSVTLTNSNVNIINSSGGNTANNFAGSGGIITLTNSNVISIYAYGGYSGNHIAGNGGSVLLTSSNATSIYAHGGDGITEAGNGGNVTIINSELNLQDLIINISGGTGQSTNGTAGFFVLNQTGLKNTFGKINFFYMQSNQTSFNSIMSISKNLISVDSGNYTDYNVSANLTLSKPVFSGPYFISRNGVECNATTSPSCYNFTALNASNVIFNVSSFTNYSIAGNFTSIVSCTSLDLANSVYYLQNDVSSSGRCFTVSAENITLDCHGYSMTGTGSDEGVYNFFAKDNLTVKNCKIYNYSYGFYTYSMAHQGRYMNIINDTIEATYQGVHIVYSNNNKITDSRIYGADSALIIESAGSNELTNLVVSSSNIDIKSYSAPTTFTNVTLNSTGYPTEITYLQTESYITVDSASPPAADPANLKNISRYVNFSTSNGLNTLLNISYDHDSLGSVKESSLKMYMHNGTAWILANATSPINSVDTSNNVVYAQINLSDSSSTILAPLGSQLACGETIINNTNLTQDLLNCPANGLNIGENDLILDCKGHSITGGTIASKGININGFNGTTITNCMISGSFGNAIFLQNSFNNLVVNSTSIGYGWGLQIDSSSNNQIINSTISATNNEAISISSSSNNTLNNNTLSGPKDLNIASSELNLIDQQINSYSFSSANIAVEKTNIGKLKYLSAISQDGSSRNFYSDVQIGSNLISVNSSASGLNVSANLTLNGISVFSNPAILRNGVKCDLTTNPSCYNFTALIGTVVFNVSSFTNYSIGEGPAPSLCGTTLTNNLNLTETLNCNGTALNIGADNLTIDCNGSSIIGNGTGFGINATNSTGAGWNLTVKNCMISNFSLDIAAFGADRAGFTNGFNGGKVNIINSTIATISSYGGNNTGQYGGNAGTTIINNSNVTTINAYGGKGASEGGNGAVVTIENSNITKINSYGGRGGATEGGDGNAINIKNSVVNTIDSYGGPSGNVGGSGGTVTVENSNVTIINVTCGDGTVLAFFKKAGDVTIKNSKVDYIYASGESGTNKGNAGNIAIENSNITTINAYGAGGGKAGNVNITNSTVPLISAYGGNSSTVGGNAGTVTIKYSNITTINAYGGKGGTGGGGNGSFVIIENSNISLINSFGGEAISGASGDGRQVNITNSTIGAINSYGGYNQDENGGRGSSVTVDNSNVPTINAYGGNGAYGGNAGDIAIENSNVPTINAYGGIATQYDGGSGGSVKLTNSNVNVVDIHGADGAEGSIGGNGGNITAINSGFNLASATVNIAAGISEEGINGIIGTLTLNESEVFSTEGRIKFRYVSTQNVTFQQIMNISNNSIYLDSNNYKDYNVSANLTLYSPSLPGSPPYYIKRNGVEICNETTSPSCYNFTALDASTVVFNVSSFTTYSTGEASSCIDLTSGNTVYYLQNNITASGTCFNIRANNITIDCQGHSITGSGAGYGINATTATNGYNITIKNCFISNFAVDIDTHGNNTIADTRFNGGSVILVNSSAAIISSYGGMCKSNSLGVCGDAGNVNITNSNVTTVNAYGGSMLPDGSVRGGNGGKIYIKNSNITTINSYGGSAGGPVIGGGKGGDVIAENSNVTTINAYSGAGIISGSSGCLDGGNVTITNSSVITVNSYSSDSEAGSGKTGTAGAVTLINSTAIIINSYGGRANIGSGGNGSNVYLLSSYAKSINVSGGKGGSSLGSGGSGGNVIIKDSSLNLSEISINATGNTGRDANGTDGFLKLNNTELTKDYGIIKFFYAESKRTNLRDIMNISLNLIELDSGNYPDYNKSANITLRVNLIILSFTNPVILRNGVKCDETTQPSCHNFTDLNLDVVEFNVSSFTNYSIGEGEAAGIAFPKNFTAVLAANRQDVILNWTSVSGADGYKIWYDENVTKMLQINSSTSLAANVTLTGENNNSWIDTNANLSTKRFYAVAAYKSSAINFTGNRTGKFNIQIYNETDSVGQSMISIPLIPSSGNLPLSDAISFDIGEDFWGAIIMNVDENGYDAWASSSYDGIGWSGQFTSLDIGKAYYFDGFQKEHTIVNVGIVPTGGIIQYINNETGLIGQTMLGWTSFSQGDLNSLLQFDIGEDFWGAIIMGVDENGYDAWASSSYDGISWSGQFTSLNPGRGYYFDGFQKKHNLTYIRNG